MNCPNAVQSAFACCLAASLPAQALEGRYQIEGQNPVQAQVYWGEAVVRRTGEAYSLIWQVGSDCQIGISLRTGSILSVAFQAVGDQGSGVASFETDGKRIVGRRWPLIGAQAIGLESWTLEARL